MRGAIADVVAGMRRDGHAVSPGEAIDAARAAHTLDLTDKDLLRLGLEAALAKDLAARASFGQHFARVFAAPVDSGERKKEGATGGDGLGRGSGSAGEGRGRGEEGQGQRRRDERPEQSKHGRLPAAVARVLHRPRRRGDRDGEEDRGDPAARELASALSPADETAIAAEAARRVARLRTALGRRRGPAPRGSIDVQRALRANARWGGVPFVLPRRARRRRPPRLLLVLDVSHSVARAAGLLLVLVGALLDGLRDVRVLVFVDRLVDATAVWRRWLRERGEAGLAPGGSDAGVLDSSPRPGRSPMASGRRGGRPGQMHDPRRRGRPGEGVRLRPGGRSFSAMLDDLADLHPGAPSDYGRAMFGLAEVARAQRGRTAAWILGDGRTNRFDPCPWALEEAAGRLERVAWFVPEPPERWGAGDSALPAYAAHVDRMYATHTLDGLADALADAIKRLR